MTGLFFPPLKTTRRYCNHPMGFQCWHSHVHVGVGVLYFILRIQQRVLPGGMYLNYSVIRSTRWLVLPNGSIWKKKSNYNNNNNNNDILLFPPNTKVYSNNTKIYFILYFYVRRCFAIYCARVHNIIYFPR